MDNKFKILVGTFVVLFSAQVYSSVIIEYDDYFNNGAHAQIVSTDQPMISESESLNHQTIVGFDMTAGDLIAATLRIDYDIFRSVDIWMYEPNVLRRSSMNAFGNFFHLLTIGNNYGSGDARISELAPFGTITEGCSPLRGSLDCESHQEENISIYFDVDLRDLFSME